jgi:NAD(P)-dependent dehydrogenase (short-subunit alcohol dehydrogenase family)
MQIAGSTALITGQGARVVIADLNEAVGAALASDIGAAARFMPTDVADEAALTRAVTAAAETGGPQILVCCAGVATAEKALGRDGPLPLERFTRVIHINLVGTFNAVRLAAHHMAQREPNAAGERGVIVMTASVAAFDGQIGQPAYAASKAAVAGMTLPLAREFARHGIRVVSIAPGIFDTPLLAGLPEAARASLAQQVPFPARLGRPDEYAALVQHIVENELLNGETIRLDGAIRMAPR